MRLLSVAGCALVALIVALIVALKGVFAESAAQAFACGVLFPVLLAVACYIAIQLED